MESFPEAYTITLSRDFAETPLESPKCPKGNKENHKNIILAADADWLFCNECLYMSMVKSSNLDTTESMLALILWTRAMAKAAVASSSVALTSS